MNDKIHLALWSEQVALNWLFDNEKSAVKIPGIGLIFFLLEEENRLPWTPGMQRGISLELAL
jgi:hypothetical protein